ncbi:hypothetical protein ACPC54_40050 [Kitasatospora sp. NPDC094028]
MARSDATASTGTAFDCTPAVWPEPVPLVPRRPLDPLGTVLIPPAERRLFTRAETAPLVTPMGVPVAASMPTPMAVLLAEPAPPPGPANAPSPPRS